jgi:hypothetical protein
VHLRRLVSLTAVVTVAGLATFGCADQSAGVRVGDDVVSESEMLDELDAFGQNEALFAGAGQSTEALRGELRSSYTQDFASEIVQQRITFMLAAQIFEDEGFELNEADRQNAEAGLRQQLQDGFDDFPEDYRESFVDDVAMYNALATRLGEDEFRQALLDKATSTDIEVSSRFGSWDEDRLTIQPPPGPVTGQGDTEPTTAAPVG